MLPQSSIDPYAELDNRADASELSEELRKPIRILQSPRHGQPRTQTSIKATRRIPV